MPLVLFSGGMDSTVALFYALHRYHHEPTYTLSFAYGQRHVAELQAALTIAEMAIGWNLVEHKAVFIPTSIIPNRSSILRGGDVTKYDAIPSHEKAAEDPAFIPHRNLLFLTIAAQYARHWNLHSIETGLRGGFPDCTFEFEEALERVLYLSDPEFNLSLHSCCHSSRAETIGLAYALPGCWAALAYSMTCFEGTEPPCGKCLPCLKRAEGFAAFGKPDPLLERLNVPATTLP